MRTGICLGVALLAGTLLATEPAAPNPFVPLHREMRQLESEMAAAPENKQRPIIKKIEDLSKKIAAVKTKLKQPHQRNLEKLRAQLKKATDDKLKADLDEKIKAALAAIKAIDEQEKAAASGEADDAKE